MIDFDDALKTVSANLTFLMERKDVLVPMHVGQIAEIAHVMAKATEDPDDKEEKRRIWQMVMQSLDGKIDTAELAKRYYAQLSARDIPQRERPPIQTICYLRNRGSDGAFDHFTAHLPGIRAMYAAGHEEALESCYDEYSDACILPLSDPERGLHTGFRGMIARYGLKIQAMVRVENREGTALDFVLLRREVRFPERDSYVAITLPVSDGLTLSQPLAAAASFGLTQGSVMKLPEVFSSVDSYDLHFYGSIDSIRQYLFYLDMTYPRYELLGVYQKERENI